jgi:hypothetical protein
METFIPWTLVKRGVRRKIITPLDTPQAFVDESAQERGGPSQQRRTAPWCGRWGWHTTGNTCSMTGASPR